MKATKRCLCCHEAFVPYPEALNTQAVCRKKRCRQWRRQQAQRRWLRNNPGYFRGLYPKTKLWLARHPGYLQRYRGAHPEYVVADNRKRGERKQRSLRRRADIQDGLRRREIARIRGLHGADIQDTLRLRLDGVLGLLGAPQRADMQDGLAWTPPPPVLSPP